MDDQEFDNQHPLINLPTDMNALRELLIRFPCIEHELMWSKEE